MRMWTSVLTMMQMTWKSLSVQLSSEDAQRSNAKLETMWELTGLYQIQVVEGDQLSLKELGWWLVLKPE